MPEGEIVAPRAQLLKELFHVHIKKFLADRRALLHPIFKIEFIVPIFKVENWVQSFQKVNFIVSENVLLFEYRVQTLAVDYIIGRFVVYNTFFIGLF